MEIITYSKGWIWYAELKSGDEVIAQEVGEYEDEALKDLKKLLLTMEGDYEEAIKEIDSQVAIMT